MRKRAIPKLSRREFARGATLAALAVSFPTELKGQQGTPAKPETAAAEECESQLSPAARAEAEAKIQNVLRKYGDRLNEEQRAELRKSLFQTQEAAEKLRAFPLENGDEPAVVFRPLVGKES